MVIPFIFIISVYFFSQAATIYGGDAGDLASAVITRGIAHPPGYPLFTMLGIAVNRVIQSGSTAYRLGFISVIPSIITLIFLYLLIYRASRDKMASLIAVLTLAFTYLYWLYSEVVEVFSLNNLFLVVLLYLMILYRFTAKKKYLFLTTFIFGLSLTHHHIILFLLPTLAYLLISTKKKISAGKAILCLFYFLAGLTPYLYVFISGSQYPSLNWLGEPTLKNFIKLVTRANYGSFVAGRFIAHQPFLRLLEVVTFVKLLYADFKLTGIILMMLGFMKFAKNNRTVFTALFLAFLSYLFLLYYASFPLMNDFMLGTFERFMLPLYLILTVFLAGGISGVVGLLFRLLTKFIRNKRIAAIRSYLYLSFFIIPLFLFSANIKKMTSLKNDLTAENLGRDILASVQSPAILFLSTDTPLFNTQYVYFSEKKYKDIYPIHFSRMLSDTYREIFIREYADIYFPKKYVSGRQFLDEFLEANSAKFTIYSRDAFDTDTGSFIPRGLLFRYYPKPENPDKAEIVRKNDILWNKFNDPLDGSLSEYKHLLLSDVAYAYAKSLQDTGYYYAVNGLDEAAAEKLKEAIRLNPEDTDNYTFLTQVYIRQEKCQEAGEVIGKLDRIGSEKADIYLLKSINYGVCFDDEKKSGYFSDQYLEALREKEIPLQKL
ncbi:hypothetical protein A3D05_04325 [Candidatus Gottesmanbacteria bacterium RIFCSPHIGHO2_02_FULL_40_24]|uniref:Uncharacterized protein n=1 Tax=Candidatus Gottesmanbacteria bacterium RIFCSPHIGHO2_01_FULL_40_15 TaxID=1798376 RepID=A0A1F5Z113_9BACT|nr:MAG: hypothetical protein A2777_01115 [Candidatus Gottesmanbacteria bacterium RIFCSPHIGHO2_01_FULL_40_15]OGG17528.1 MAG: hypothetical protein A3D05_04325 [Candidatus Gottesmanbacteria bacterium RIFCSPHIGHO2_02_FULL_40_24]OGG25171.1 MAG: hypothetical protein A3E42_01240 [Candidatus Gottesmanbacteria bacterium RIFCSPHIGHO2_12_FULL_40_13]